MARGDLLEALGHVEVDRRRDLAQVAQRLGDAPGVGLPSSMYSVPPL
jgi:hypothetical protein